MDWLTFIAKIVDSIVWPLMIFSLALVFLKPLKSVIQAAGIKIRGLREVSYKGLCAGFHKLIPPKKERRLEEINETNLAWSDYLWMLERWVTAEFQTLLALQAIPEYPAEQMKESAEFTKFAFSLLEKHKGKNNIPTFLQEARQVLRQRKIL